MPITLDELGRRIDSVQNSIVEIQSKQLSFYEKITDQLTSLVARITKIEVLEVRIDHVTSLATECRNKNYTEHVKIFEKLAEINDDVADVAAITPTRDEIEQKDEKAVSKTEKIISQVWEVLKLILAVIIAAKVAGKI